LTLSNVAAFLTLETRGLLLGESADPPILASISSLAQADPSGGSV
jgi:hypothetical protein